MDFISVARSKQEKCEFETENPKIWKSNYLYLSWIWQHQPPQKGKIQEFLIKIEKKITKNLYIWQAKIGKTQDFQSLPIVMMKNPDAPPDSIE